MSQEQIDISSLDSAGLQALIERAEKQKKDQRKEEVKADILALKTEANALALKVEETITKHSMSDSEITGLNSAFDKLFKVLGTEAAPAEDSSSPFKGIVAKFAAENNVILNIGDKRVFMTNTPNGRLTDFYKQFVIDATGKEPTKRSEVLATYTGTEVEEDRTTYGGLEAIQLLKDGVEHPDRKKIMKQVVKQDL
jgi:hypothetical protein